MVWTKIGTTTIAACMTADIITVANTLRATDFCCDFCGCDLWNDTGTRNQVNVCTNVLDWDAFRDGSNTNESTSFDLGAGNVSNTQWVLRYKITVDAVTSPSSQALTTFIGVGDQPHCVAAGSSTQEATYNTLRRESGGASEWQLRTVCNGSMATDGIVFSHTLVAETLFVEIKRVSGTLTKSSLYSDTNYTCLIEHVTFAAAAASGGYRYISVRNFNGGGNNGGTINGTIDCVQFWDGTSIAETNMGKYIKITANTIHCGNARPSIIFNSCDVGVCNTSGNYAYAETLNSVVTCVASVDDKTQIAVWQTEGVNHLIEGDILNDSCQAKLLIAHQMNLGATGVGTAPNRGELVGKWDITTECIGKITIINDGGSGSFDAGTSLTVWATC